MTSFLKKDDIPTTDRTAKFGYLLASFFIPLIILILSLIALHITPFGSHTLIVSDGNASYLPMLSFLGRLFKGEEGILYSFKNGLGGNNLSSLAWGQINPLFGLAAFGDPETYPEIYTWISVLNFAVSGVFMMLLLGNVNGWRFSNLLFSTTYALIGFNVTNHFQIIFFVGVHLLPLMTLGLYRLMHGKSPALYILSLAYCIFANFFFGYVLCFASVVFFLSSAYAEWEAWYGKKKRIFITYTISSLFAGVLPAFILLPTVKSMTGGGRIDQTQLSDFSMDGNMPFLAILSKFFTGAHSTSELSNGLPAVFCGILVVALVMLYFFDRKKEPRRKIAAGIVVGFYFLAFLIRALSSVMQGFSHTNWFNYRFSFVFSFVLILLAAEQYRSLSDITMRDVKKCYGIIVISAILIFSQQFEFMNTSCVLLDLALLFFMGLGFYIYKTKPEKSPERLLSAFLLFLVSGNLYANYIVCADSVKVWEMDTEIYAEHNLVEGAMADALREADPTLYRVETEDPRYPVINHDAHLYNYQGVCNYSPMERGFIHDSLNRLGLTFYSYGNYYCAGSPAALDSLFGIKYVMALNDLAEEKNYERRVGAEDTMIYQNPYVLPFAVAGTPALNEVVLGDNVFENLNAVWKGLSGGSGDIFVSENAVSFSAHNDTEDLTVEADALTNWEEESEEAVSETYIEYTFTAQQDGPVYLFDMMALKTGMGQTTPSIQYVGTYKKGDTVRGEFRPTVGGYFTTRQFKTICSCLRFAYAVPDVLASYAAALQEKSGTVVKESERVLTGELTADENTTLFFSIPWDEGWTCYIDGEKAEIVQSCGCFMTVAVPAGTHTYEMRFFPAWMKTGIVISIVSLAACVVYLILFNKYTKKEEPVTENDPSSDDTPETERTGALPETVPEILTKEAVT